MLYNHCCLTPRSKALWQSHLSCILLLQELLGVFYFYYNSFPMEKAVDVIGKCIRTCHTLHDCCSASRGGDRGYLLVCGSLSHKLLQGLYVQIWHPQIFCHCFSFNHNMYTYIFSVYIAERIRLSSKSCS